MDGTTTDAAVYGLRVNLYDGTDLYAKRRGKPSIIEQARTELRSAHEDSDLSTTLDQIYEKYEPEKDPPKRLEKALVVFQSADSIDAWFSSLPALDQQDIGERIKRLAAQDARL